MWGEKHRSGFVRTSGGESAWNRQEMSAALQEVESAAASEITFLMKEYYLSQQNHDDKSQWGSK